MNELFEIALQGAKKDAETAQEAIDKLNGLIVSTVSQRNRPYLMTALMETIASAGKLKALLDTVVFEGEYHKAESTTKGELPL